MYLRLVIFIKPVIALGIHGVLPEHFITDNVLIASYRRVKDDILDYLDFATLYEIYVLGGLTLPTYECVGLDPPALHLGRHQYECRLSHVLPKVASYQESHGLLNLSTLVCPNKLGMQVWGQSQAVHTVHRAC